MRLAICIASAYEQNPGLERLPGADLDLEAVSVRLAQPDTGYVVHAFPALRGLAEGIEQLIAQQPAPLESLLVYFSGYALLSAERGPALLLDGDRVSVLSLKRLTRILELSAPESLVLLDVAVPRDETNTPEELVQAL